MNLMMKMGVGLLVIAAATSCTQKNAKNSDHVAQDPFFPPEGTPSNTARLFDRQFAVAAAKDGTLYETHFDGTQLNSLGQQKLQAMVDGKPQETPLAVYLKLPPSQLEFVGARQDAVIEFLATAGMAPATYVLNVGDNPRNFFRTDENLDAYANTDTGEAPAGGATIIPMP